MNKAELNQKLSDLEEAIDESQYEALRLRSLINASPEPQRTPEAGDVWSFAGGGNIFLVNRGDQATTLSSETGFNCGEIYHDLSQDVCLQEGRGTYLGKFNEVYCKISDVLEALSIKDRYGDSVLKTRFNDQTNIHIDSDTSSKVYESLRNLNIITD